MQTRSKANALVRHIRGLPSFQILDAVDAQYNHMGATLVDAILQAGTTYTTVVLPRVREVKDHHPEAATTSGFWRLVEKEGARQLLRWKHDEKPNRVIALTRFLIDEGVETEAEFAEWLTEDANLARLRQLRGIGPKTVDYLKMLVGIETSAADRYVFRLLEEAGTPAADYEEATEILNLAADSIGVPRSVFDQSVWRFMSNRGRRNSQSLARETP